jgi:hypothetical protein
LEFACLFYQALFLLTRAAGGCPPHGDDSSMSDCGNFARYLVNCGFAHCDVSDCGGVGGCDSAVVINVTR